MVLQNMHIHKMEGVQEEELTVQEKGQYIGEKQCYILQNKSVLLACKKKEKEKELV